MRFTSKEQNIWFTSDTHWGHKNILKFQAHTRKFETIEDMDNYLINDWNNKVKPNDIIFHLGDISWYEPNKTREIISQLNGTKILIKGNHDRHEVKYAFDYAFDYQGVKIDNHFIVLLHYPIIDWDRKHHGSFHLHGHVHGRNMGAIGRALDVGVDNHPNLTIFSFEEVKQILLPIEAPKTRYNVD